MKKYDVIIVGAGLAGLSLARQLKLKDSDLRIAILESKTFPYELGTHKVGESTVEIAGYYLGQKLELDDYLKENHYLKFGLRFFWSPENEDFSKRPEIGLSKRTSFNSYQIDRGRLENDLCEMILEMGVELFTNIKLNDLVVDKECNKVLFSIDEVDYEFGAKWVIDSAGRQKWLMKKFDLEIDDNQKRSSAWFRVKGDFKVDDFVPKSNVEWHSKVKHERFYGTNHILGEGYWIWVIPLSCGMTSVGICISEKHHNFNTISTRKRVDSFLTEFDPFLQKKLQGFEVLDFKVIRNFSYSSKKIFSTDGWACTGDAAAFPDPFYSPGSNQIGYTNTILTHIITENITCEKRISEYNEFVLSQNDWLSYNTYTTYDYFGNPQVNSLAYLWDLVTGWALGVPLMFNDLYLDPETFKISKEVIDTFYALAIKMKNIFLKWNKCSNGTFTFDFIDYYHIPFITEMYDRNVKKDKKLEDVIEDLKYSMVQLKKMSCAIFHLIIKDIDPENENLLLDFRLNPEELNLNESIRNNSALFENELVDYKIIYQQLYDCFLHKEVVQQNAEISFNLNL
ncbi:NAD(P)/FAD-dependent oxidoreductase [Flavobacterium sp.]|uniref:NAD(P)/FAD-dependent oxidoreductase n=1 Tax=Flavobacterium sp. TaxID=239 RepID=UPI003D12E4FC